MQIILMLRNQIAELRMDRDEMKSHIGRLYLAQQQLEQDIIQYSQEKK
jgi:hypothetical protein